MSELKLQQCRLDGRYDIIECLGRGSYSEVYLARDVSPHHDAAAPDEVVIKALNSSLQGAPDHELEQTLLENFRNEAVALDRVRHPHIINRLGHGTAIDLQGRTFHYLVFEYLPGGDLQALCRHHPLALDRALFYLEQVCDGLATRTGAADSPRIKRTICSSPRSGEVKIADFGRQIEAATGRLRASAPTFTLPPNSPFVQTARSTGASQSATKQLTPAADVYSLAKTLSCCSPARPRAGSRSNHGATGIISGKPWSRFLLRVLRPATRPIRNRAINRRRVLGEGKMQRCPRTRRCNSGGGRMSRHICRIGERGDTPPPRRCDHLHSSRPPPLLTLFTSPAATRRRRGASGRPRIVVPVHATRRRWPRDQ